LCHFFPHDFFFFFPVLSFCFAARLKHLVRVSFKYQKEASDRQFSVPFERGTREGGAGLSTTPFNMYEAKKKK
jgi:hypothetical protein